MKEVDAVIIEDYGKGVITPRLLAAIVPLATRLKKVVAVDPKEEHFAYYKGASLITPNMAEAHKASGVEIKDEASLFKAGLRILKRLGCGIVLITLGENGMCVFRRKARPKHIPTVAQEVFDVSGAGDTVIGTYTLAMISGADPVQAAHIANCAAGIVVGKVGTATVTPAELTARIEAEAGKVKT
jgi:D-beta-D-heptose 7-phosphate kinase/D-beta-D-heptose 1-phosphate adenosyltransferase